MSAIKCTTCGIWMDCDEGRWLGDIPYCDDCGLIAEHELHEKHKLCQEEIDCLLTRRPRIIYENPNS